MPETTDKIMFEGADNGHGFAAYPYGEVQDYALYWLKYHVLGDTSACEYLLEIPLLSSEYLTNIECAESITGDINGDLLEAQAFGFLAIRSIKNLPLSFKTTTGSIKNVSGGITNDFN